jgi:uncharacterized protein (TIGR02145 family)
MRKFLTTIITTLLAATVFCQSKLTDIDGNHYKTVKIGKQVWMKENLKTTKYSNGDIIGTTTSATLDISTENMPKYQWSYQGDEGKVAVYGRLYTWYTITDNRNICPEGWHVPTDTEWTILTDYLINNGFGNGGNGIEITKSMAATSGWIENSLTGNVGNDQTSNNKSGFTAYPGGYRYGSGLFNGFGSYGYWWSATELYQTSAWYRSLNDHRNDVYSGSSSKQNGVSIRCIKD